MSFKKMLAMVLLVGSWNACSEQSEMPPLVDKKTPHEEARKVVRNYVLNHGSSLAPNISTYRAAGLKDLETLDVITLNDYLRRLEPEDVDTPEELAWFVGNFKDFDQDKILNYPDLDDDGDGYGDGYEISMDRDPFDPMSTPKSTPFIITIETSADDLDFTFHAVSGEKYNYNVDCENDGLIEAKGVRGDYTCTFLTPGLHEISIYDNSGLREGFPQINIAPDHMKLIEINQWGSGKWTSFEQAFRYCENLSNTHATDVPDLTDVLNLSKMFMGAKAFNQDISKWDTRNVSDMSLMFASHVRRAHDGSHFEDIGYHKRFYQGAFNQDIGSWNTSKVVNMRLMFYGLASFDQDIGNWDTGQVRIMNSMFWGAKAFNQDISRWNTSNITVGEMHNYQ